MYATRRLAPGPLFLAGMLQFWCFLGGLVPVSAQQTAPANAPEASNAGSGGADIERLGGYTAVDGVVPPKVLRAPDPQFTDKARRKKLGGTCILSTLVDAQGNPHDIRVVKSIADGIDPKLHAAAVSLDQSAMKTLSQYRFQPATRQGVPVPYKLNVEMQFRIY